MAPNSPIATNPPETGRTSKNAPYMGKASLHHVFPPSLVRRISPLRSTAAPLRRSGAIAAEKAKVLYGVATVVQVLPPSAVISNAGLIVGYCEVGGVEPAAMPCRASENRTDQSSPTG